MLVYMCGHWSTQKLKHERIYLVGISLGLTFTGLDALKPPVISVSVADTSTILIPSAARSTTTDSSGFLECAALWTPHRIDTRRGDGWRANRSGDRRVDY